VYSRVIRPHVNVPTATIYHRQSSPYVTHNISCYTVKCNSLSMKQARWYSRYCSAVMVSTTCNS